MSQIATPYPMTFDVERQYNLRNRLTVAFRLILAIPHTLLVGGPAVVGLGATSFVFTDIPPFGGIGISGALGAVAGVVALISWFAIVFTGRQPRGLWDLTNFYMRWRSKAVVYTSLFRDDYPPFGDERYPVTFSVDPPPEERDRVTVGFRIFLVIPHIIVLFFVGLAFFVTSVIGWFAILFTGSYPVSLYDFGVGVTRWSLRVETYMLLMHDVYPPFSLD